LKTDTYPRIIWPEDFDDRAAYEIEMKDWLGGVKVELAEGLIYSLFFFDPVRLKQDLESMVALGRPCLDEPGLIVVPSVTVENIEKSVTFLARRDYFSHLRPNSD